MADYLYKELSFAVIGAAIEVHKVLGPGFLEAVYDAALAHELTLRHIPFKDQSELAVKYKNEQIGLYYPDFLVGGEIILELKSCSTLIPAHAAQALNYLAATGLRLAILLNFGTRRLQIKRIIR